MSNDLAIANLPQTFRENLREKVMAATLDLIPKEVLDNYISREITAFFENEELLTVKETEVVMDNPRWDQSKYTGYGNEREIKLKAIAFGSRMTPFRQLVWTLLYTDLRPKKLCWQMKKALCVRSSMTGSKPRSRSTWLQPIAPCSPTSQTP